ncbi:exodeoxyribonuclease III, partial [Mytilinidion resinicola]
MDREISPPPRKRRKLSAPSDADPKDQTPVPTDSSRSIRIFAWNINGIRPFLQQTITSFFKSATTASSSTTFKECSLRALLHRHHWPQLLLLQEVKINQHDEATQKAVRIAVNRPCQSVDDGPSYIVHFTLPRDAHNARGFGGKIYGIASIVRSDFFDCSVVNIRDVDWDLEGRVHIIELKQKIAIFNIYAVNGTNNAYRSPTTGAVIGTRHDRKLDFHKLLLQECKSMEALDWDVILAGDLNVARSLLDGWPGLRTFPEEHVKNWQDFNDKFFDDEDGLRAADVWRKLKGSERRYTYFPRGVPWGSSCDRVDLIIGSRRFFEAGHVLDTGILDSAEERGPSDHVPLWVEI